MKSHHLRMALMGAFLSATVAPAAFAQTDAGAYLAARQASFGSDFAAASNYFSQALVGDPDNPALLENAMTGYLAAGDLAKATEIAGDIVAAGYESQISHMLQNIAAAQAGDWEQIFVALEAGRTVGPLVDGLSQAWAYVGQGQMTRALEAFDGVIEQAGLQTFGNYHKALALASVGDFESADAILKAAASTGLRLDRRGVIALAQIESQLGRNDSALTAIEQAFGGAYDTGLLALVAKLEAGEAVPFDTVTNASQGMAEMYHQVAIAVFGEAPDSYALLYARAANAMDPANTDALLTTAELLEKLERYELANTVYASIAADDPAFLTAELGRAEVLRKGDRPDAAIEVLTALARNWPTETKIYSAMGDIYRGQDKFAEARDSYTKALEFASETDPSRWFVHYVRAIVYHRLDDWADAEADFRASLALRPDQPQVLNYLGYSLIERGEKMDEALEMIQTAVDAQPDNGAIVDSLGWVQFLNGDYAEAVINLEQAASLEPVDPVVNDHLGDAYWAVGREIEARFQWNRALSFDPEEAEADRIRRKLDIGLDAVLIEEGAPPTRVANDNN